MADRAFKAIVAGVIAFGIGAIVLAEYAEAQEAPKIMCGPLDKVREGLAEHLDQVEVGGGIVNDQTIVTIFVSPGGATWTALAVNSDGVACLLAHGEDWFPGSLPKLGDPA